MNEIFPIQISITMYKDLLSMLHMVNLSYVYNESVQKKNEKKTKQQQWNKVNLIVIKSN